MSKPLALVWQTEELPCREQDSEMFFPDAQHATSMAKAIEALCCSRCPVRELCLEAAIETKSVGVWAGTTTEQRFRMAEARRKAKYRNGYHVAPRKLCRSGRHPWQAGARRCYLCQKSSFRPGITAGSKRRKASA